MNPTNRYIDKIMVITRPYGLPVAAKVLIATSVKITGRHGAAQRREAFEEIGYPAKRKPSLPSKDNLHPVFREILRPFAEEMKG